jgi:hypothetical protein
MALMIWRKPGWIAVTIMIVGILFCGTCSANKQMLLFTCDVDVEGVVFTDQNGIIVMGGAPPYDPIDVYYGYTDFENNNNIENDMQNPSLFTKGYTSYTFSDKPGKFYYSFEEDCYWDGDTCNIYNNQYTSVSSQTMPADNLPHYILLRPGISEEGKKAKNIVDAQLRFSHDTPDPLYYKDGIVIPLTKFEYCRNYHVDYTVTMARGKLILANPLITGSVDALANPKSNEQQLAKTASEKPYFVITPSGGSPVKGENGYSSGLGNKHIYIPFDIKIPFWRQGDNDCPKYIKLDSTREGTLWDYLYNPDRGHGVSQYNRIKCQPGGKTSDNLLNCVDWRFLPVEADDDCTYFAPCIDGNYPIDDFRGEFDYNKIGKNDRRLNGQFLGFKKIEPADIIWIRSDGMKEDSTKIASGSYSTRLYADMLLLGDCNRDHFIDYSDLTAMTEIVEKNGEFDTMCDMNGDRVIDQKDIDLLIRRLQPDARNGDCNNDFRIDESDAEYMSVLMKEGKEVPPNCNMNSDGKLTQEDLDLLNKKRADAGSSHPQGQDKMNLQAGEVQPLAGNENVLTQEKGPSILDMLAALPETFASLGRSTPDDQITVYYIDENPPAGPGTGSVQVVMNPETGSDGSGAMKKDTGAGTGQEDQKTAVQIVMESDRSGEEDQQAGTEQQAATGQVRSTDVSSQTYLLAQNCPAGYSVCSGLCVNMSVDTANCGACGHACPSGWWCQLGECMSALHIVTTGPTRIGQAGTAREHL